MAVVRDLSISETNSAGCAEDSVKETGWSLSVFFCEGLFADRVFFLTIGEGFGIDLVERSMG